MMAGPVVLGVIGVAIVIWAGLSLAGAAPNLNLHKCRLRQLDDELSRKLLRRILADVSELDAEWLKARSFVPVGAFQIDGLMGRPRIVVWEKRGEATWLCGYVLSEGRCRLEIVSRLKDSVLTTGSTKDGQLIPAADGCYLQTFDVENTADLWGYHQQAVRFLRDSFGIHADNTLLEFGPYFTAVLRNKGMFIRHIFFWPARIPWWYMTRRMSRHNRHLSQFYRK